MATTKGNDSMLSRRAFVGKLAAGAAAAGAVASLGGRAQARTTGAGAAAVAEPAAVAGGAVPPVVASAPAPWELLGPLTAGAEVAPGWTVAELSPVAAGSSVVTLRSAQGRTQRVHLCRNGGTPAGLVHTERYDLVVMNGGAGDLPTDEGLAQAVAALAHAVARNEAAQPVAGELLAHAERVARYGTDAKLR